jgi:hypothetical protein
MSASRRAGFSNRNSCPLSLPECPGTANDDFRPGAHYPVFRQMRAEAGRALPDFVEEEFELIADAPKDEPEHAHVAPGGGMGGMGDIGM